MMMTYTAFLQAAIAAGILLMPFLFIILAVFVLLFHLFNGIFRIRIGKRLGDLDSIDRSIIAVISFVTSLAIIAAILYVIFEFLLPRIVFL
jgi:succinate dehydrogenase/fumarate reductase cytochrome b subunit